MEGLMYIGIHPGWWHDAEEEEDVPSQVGKTLQIGDGTEVMSYVTHWPNEHGLGDEGTSWIVAVEVVRSLTIVYVQLTTCTVVSVETNGMKTDENNTIQSIPSCHDVIGHHWSVLCLLLRARSPYSSS